MSVPLVSILCATYNHELYIADAIDGFLMQKTDFEFEIIIHDDASTDKTAEIVKSYESKYPEKFNNIYQTENQFSKDRMSVSRILFKAAKGNYIALCEGDDYWTDPNKLQKQVDFLEKNEKFIFTFHDCVILKQNTGEKYLRVGDRDIEEIVNLESVIKENNIATASLFFRNLIEWHKLPNWFFHVKKGDYALVVLLAELGKGKYFYDVMSLYRVHDGGVWSGVKDQSLNLLADIQFYDFLLDYFNTNSIKRIIHKKRSLASQNLGLNYLRKGIVINGLRYILINRSFLSESEFNITWRKIFGALKLGLFVKFLLNRSKTKEIEVDI